MAVVVPMAVVVLGVLAGGVGLRSDDLVGFK